MPTRSSIPEEKKYFRSNAVIKAANYCARKFCSVENNEKNEYFIKYCTKKINKVLRGRSSHKDIQIESIQKEIEVFNKMF